MTDAPQVLLEHHFKKLKLPTFSSEHGKLARACAAEGKDHVQYLLRLCELELPSGHGPPDSVLRASARGRERRMIERRIEAAKFPATKSLDGFDFKVIPSLNKMLVMELARCEFVTRRENIIALGPSGTGKTHAALGLGLAACQKGMRVRFVTAAALVNEMIEAVDERRLQRLQKQLAAQDLLVIDELGFVPLSKTGAELLFEVISHCCPVPATQHQPTHWRVGDNLLPQDVGHIPLPSLPRLTRQSRVAQGNTRFFKPFQRVTGSPGQAR